MPSPATTEAATIDESYAELSFRMARCQLALGAPATAYRNYLRARDLDVLRFRTDSHLNGLIRSIYSRHASPAVRFFDAEAVVTNASSMGIPGADYFWDHVHFTFAGNYLMARGLVDQVIPLLPEPSRQTALANTNVLTEDQCAQRLAFTDGDHRAVLNLMFRRVQQAPFNAQLDHEKRFEKWSLLLSEMDQKRDNETLAHEVRTYYNALARRPDDWILHHRLALLLESSGDIEGAEEQWRQVLELVPGYSEASFKLAGICAGKSKSAEAEQLRPVEPEIPVGNANRNSHRRKSIEDRSPRGERCWSKRKPITERRCAIFLARRPSSFVFLAQH
jgi:tetratricopeptide (TPR) repeat protein